MNSYKNDDYDEIKIDKIFTSSFFKKTPLHISSKPKHFEQLKLMH